MSDGLGISIITLRESLLSIGLRAIQIIRARTLRGQGPRGPLDAYSERAFAKPFDPITQKARQALGDMLHLFETKRGTLWAIIEGGYAAYKRAAYPQDSGTVNMSVTGQMMGSLTVLSIDEHRGEIVIGFSRAEAAERAYYQTVTGVGADHTVRNFLDLSEGELATLGEMAAGTVQVRT